MLFIMFLAAFTCDVSAGAARSLTEDGQEGARYTRGKVVDRYSACSWTDNGDGTSTVSVTLHFLGYWVGFPDLEIADEFISRAVVVYVYDENGVTHGIAGNRHPILVTLNGEKNHSGTQAGKHNVYGGGIGVMSHWHLHGPFTGRIKVRFKNSTIGDWPAVGIQAANRFQGPHAGARVEITGMAYITRDGDNNPCTVVSDPSTPPASPIAIKVTAPDWDLGELPRGASKKTFASTAEQLCFTYTGADVSEKSFIINAGNANGVTNGLYQLTHLSDPSQVVPYMVTLDSGSSKLTLPNKSNVARSFDPSGKTCFVPTFWTAVTKDVKDGDYNDVLTFTVFTKS
ncbi:hypothetical protein [Burkholderia territorii]|uniref:hypothetical protein n=1 Tax=Burkholderia territorii TaxID=1503055 RepID=UPI0012DA1097|nr:hypothetical protein [Burkholderia territorii]